MFCISLDSCNPFFNLAVDEYLLKRREEDYFLLGINDRSVIIGKHQVAHRETDTRFVTINDIPVIRRITGGGTVFHDTGNLNFSFIMNSEAGKQIDFRKYTLPVIEFLSSLNVDAKFQGKNDLKVNGLKISGNAEHVYRNRVLHHGTLLFNADIESLNGSIRKDTGKYSSRAVNSNPSDIANLVSFSDKFKDIYDFRKHMMDWFLENIPGTEAFHLTDCEIREVESLAAAKYKTWEWNYAYGPEYHFNNAFYIEGRECFCRLFVKDGIIRECKINGSTELEWLGEKLIGCRHIVQDVLEILRKEEILISGFDVYTLF